MTAVFVPGMLPDEYETLRRTVAKFTDDEVAPVSAELDAKHEFPYELVRRMGDMGLFGLPFPEEYGGMDGDYSALCLALEEIARENQSLAMTLEAGVSLGAMPIYRFGTDEQKRELLPQVIDGRGLAAFGLTAIAVRQRTHGRPRRPCTRDSRASRPCMTATVMSRRAVRRSAASSSASSVPTVRHGSVRRAKSDSAA